MHPLPLLGYRGLIVGARALSAQGPECQCTGHWHGPGRPACSLRVHSILAYTTRVPIGQNRDEIEYVGFNSDSDLWPRML